MSSHQLQRPNLCRFLIKKDRDGQHRWYVYNAAGTMVGRHPEGFSTELEARRDAERHRADVAKAPIIGEGDEGVLYAVSDEPSGRPHWVMPSPAPPAHRLRAQQPRGC